MAGLTICCWGVQGHPISPWNSQCVPWCLRLHHKFDQWMAVMFYLLATCTRVAFPSRLSWFLPALYKARESDFIYGRSQSWRRSIQLWAWGQMITHFLLRSCLRDRGFSCSQDPLFCCCMMLVKDTVGNKADHIPALRKLTPGILNNVQEEELRAAAWCPLQFQVDAGQPPVPFIHPALLPSLSMVPSRRKACVKSSNHC